MIRDDQSDLIYKTTKEKYDAIVDDIEASRKKGQPVLTGTISIENSEKISRLLKKRGLRHSVLNAKHHEDEAQIVAQAGAKNAITIATNMAGRGTDIVLGGNAEKLMENEGIDPLDKERWDKRLAELIKECEENKKEVLASGGLRIIGSERHESRRIDNQLRGRSGRQGDPGESRFYISLEDDLMRIFGSDRIATVMDKLGMQAGEPIEHKMVSRAIENAQKKVEGHNYDIRKHLLEYDDVMNKQREVIYSQRGEILEGANLREEVIDMARLLAEDIVYEHCPEKAHPEDWNLDSLKELLPARLGLQVSVDEGKNLTIGEEKLSFDLMLHEDVIEAVSKEVEAAYKRQEEIVGDPERLRGFERYIMLNVLDSMWKDHLLHMDHLKEGVGFRGYAQKNPLNEYKREGHQMFQDMINRFKDEVASVCFKVKVEAGADEPLEQERREQKVIEHRGEAELPEQTTVRRTTPKVGRNDPCPCGSGKKYKKCHGK